MKSFARLFLLAFLLFTAIPGFTHTETDMPRIVRDGNGTYTLHVDGEPFIILGAQLGNSSAWPDIFSWQDVARAASPVLDSLQQLMSKHYYRLQQEAPVLDFEAE